LKILQLYNKVPYPSKDGGSIAVMNISKGFSQNNNQVTILCFNTKKHFVDVEKIKLPYKNIKIETVLINTEITIKKALENLLFSKLPYNAERFISQDFENKLYKILKEETFDIIQVEGLYMMPYVKNIRKISKAKIAYRAHNIEHEIWENGLKNETNILKKAYLKIIFKRLKKFEIYYLNKYDYLIPITDRDGKNFTKLGNTQPIHVSPTGINTSEYIQDKTQQINDFSLFHLGSLDWSPNQEGLKWFLENIWGKLETINTKISLSIAGRNAPLKLEKYFANFNLKYHGETENAIDFIHEHSIMIVPLLSGSGMRIKILEGMAASKLIITTTKGAEGIGGKSFEHYIIADTPEEFIRTIKTLTQDNSLIKKISLAGHKFISENFDNFAISKSLTEFYNKNDKT